MSFLATLLSRQNHSFELHLTVSPSCKNAESAVLAKFRPQQFVFETNARQVRRQKVRQLISFLAFRVLISKAPVLQCLF